MAGYSLCKDCDFKPKNKEDLLSHGKSSGHTIMHKADTAGELKARLQKLAGPLEDKLNRLEKATKYMDESKTLHEGTYENVDKELNQLRRYKDTGKNIY